MATQSKTQNTPPPNAKEIRGPNGDLYIVPMNTQIWTGWTDTGKYQTLPAAPSPMKFAPLKSAKGTKEYVAVGGTRANDLLGQGWVIEGSGNVPTDATSKDKVGGTNANQTGGPVNTTHVLDGGDFYVCKFSDDPTPNNGIDETAMKWVFDVKKKVFRPIAGAQAEQWLAKQLGLGSIDTHSISTKDLQSESGVFYGASFLPKSYAIQNDGTFPAYPDDVMYRADSPNPSQSAKDQITGKIYGKDQMSAKDLEPIVSKTIDFVKYLRDGKYISQGTYDKLSANNWTNSSFADSVNAVAYGGYSMDDLWRQYKGIDNGETPSGFSTKLDLTGYRQTNAYQSSVTNSAYAPTGDLAAKITAYSGVAVSALPDDLYSGTSTITKSTTSADLDSARQLNAAYYDILKLQATANTEAEQSQAKSAYAQFKAKVEKTYGVTLSNNAFSSWSAVQSIMDQANQAGVGGSGYERGLIQDKLRGSARTDAQTREQIATAKSEQEISNALKYGSAAEIKALVAKLDSEDSANGVDSSNYRSNQFKAPTSLNTAYSIENLRKLYPGLNDAELQEIRSGYVDENGNIASTSAQNLAKSKSDLTTKNIETGVTQIDAEKARQAKIAADAISATTGKSPTTGSEVKKTPTIPDTTSTKTDTPTVTTPTPTVAKAYASDSGVAAGEAELQKLAKASTAPTIPTPTVSSPLTPPTKSSVPTGATYISNASGLAGLTEKQIYRDTSTGKIYKLANVGK